MGIEFNREVTLTSLGDWAPQDNGYVGWSIDPMGTASSTLASGTLYVTRIPVKSPATITKIAFACLTAGSGFTSATAALFDPSDFSVVEESDSLTTAFGSTGIVEGTVSATTVVTPYIYAGLLIVATGMPAVARASTSGGANSSLVNAGLDSSNYRSFFGGTGLSAMPDPIGTFTPVSLTPWVAVG